MIEKVKHSIAILLTVLLVGFIAAPIIISSLDDSADVTGFFSITEEEENENAKLVLDNNFDDLSDSTQNIEADMTVSYTFKKYAKPHLNLISPPPELLLI